MKHTHKSISKKRKKKRKLSLQYMDADLNELEPFK